MDEPDIALRPIGRVESPYATPLDAPPQGAFAAVEAVVAVRPEYAAGLEGVAAGDALLVVWWAHAAERGVLGRPGSNGVFTMRTPHRPNPIGLSEVTVVRREGAAGERLVVTGLDAIDKTPVLDIKSVRAEYDGWLPIPTTLGD